MAFLLGRASFALVVGYLAFGNLLDLESSAGYAKSKGAPLASLTVPLGSLGLVAGALAVLAGFYPAIDALAVVGFLVPITVIMHDFWTMEGQSRQNEQIHFLENVGLIGAALVFLALSATAWPMAVGVEPAESAVGQSTDPVFYLVLFSVSSFVAVPLEALFFRGVVQRHLEERVHVAVAIGVAILLFTFVHVGVNVDAGGQSIALGMFFTFGVVLGAGYALTENLFVSLIGHVVFNSVRTLLRALETAV